MKLQELISRHQGISLADRRNNTEILHFFNETPMKGEKIELLYDRSPDFFSFLEFTSHDYFVFTYSEENQIKAIGTLTLRQGFINGKLNTVGYLGDLRVKNQKKALLVWRRFYDDLMIHFSNIEEFKDTRYLFTAVIDSNVQARQALIAQSKQKFQYHKICQYKMVNIFNKFFPTTNFNYQFMTLDQVSRDQLTHFLNINQSRLNFGLSAESIFEKINFLPRLDNESVIVVKENEQIIAFTYLWSPSPEKKILVRNFPKFLTLILSLLNRSKRKLGPKEELRILYLNSLTFSHDIHGSKLDSLINELISFVMKTSLMKEYHSLAFPDFADHPISQYLKLCLKNETEMALYQVLPRHQFEELSLEEGSCFFEMSLV